MATPQMGCNSKADAEAAMLLSKEGGYARRISKLDEKSGVAALKMAGLSGDAAVYTRGYLVYQNDTTGELGTIYTEIVKMTGNTCE